ncbi:MAG: hypothetical protein U0Q15_20775 [Kineosporiaceae bacterium]
MPLTESVRSFQVPDTPGTRPDRRGALGADLAGDAGDLGGEGGQLVDHRVDGGLELEQLALDVDGDLLAEVAPRDRGGHLGDVADLGGEVARHAVHRVGEVLPGAGHARHLGLAAEAPLGADLAGHAGDLVGERLQRARHRVERVGELGDLAAGVDGDLLAEVAAGDGAGHGGDVADLAGEVGGEQVDLVDGVAPDAAGAVHLRLAAQSSLGADGVGHAGHLGGELAQHVDHAVDPLGLLPPVAALQQQRHLGGEVARGDGVDGVDDAAHLRADVAEHRVDGVDEVGVGARGLADARLPAELAVDPEFGRGAGDLGGQLADLGDERVGDPGVAQGVPAQGALPVANVDARGEVALGEARDDAHDVGVQARVLLDRRVRGLQRHRPRPGQVVGGGALDEPPLARRRALHARGLGALPVQPGRDVVDGPGDLVGHGVAVGAQPDLGVAVPDRLQRREDPAQRRVRGGATSSGGGGDGLGHSGVPFGCRWRGGHGRTPDDRVDHERCIRDLPLRSCEAR